MIHAISIFNFTVFLFIAIFTIIVINNENLLRKTSQQKQGNGKEVMVSILEFLFRLIGQLLILIATVLFVPSLILYAETERCKKESELLPGDENVYFTCGDVTHSAAVASTTIGVLCMVICAVFAILFVNSQFPSK